LNQGDTIKLHDCSAAANEQFIFNSSDNTIRVASKPSMCFNAASADLEEGDTIQLQECSAAANEQFVYLAGEQ